MDVDESDGGKDPSEEGIPQQQQQQHSWLEYPQQSERLRVLLVERLPPAGAVGHWLPLLFHCQQGVVVLEEEKQDLADCAGDGGGCPTWLMNHSMVVICVCV